MPYIDEEIAKKLKKERLKLIRAENEEKEREFDESIDPCEVREGIKKGKCRIGDREFTFSRYSACEGKFNVYLPNEEILIKRDTNANFQTVNDDLGFSFTLLISPVEGSIKTPEEYKKAIRNNLRKLNNKWLSDGVTIVEGRKMLYMEFVTITGLVIVHQNMWYWDTPYGVVSIVVNYDHKENKYWKHIIGEIRNTIELNVLE